MFSLHISHPPGSSVTIWLDGKLSTLPFVPEAESATNSSFSWVNSGLESMSVVENSVTLGDHQLFVHISSDQNLVVFDRIDFWFPSNYPTPTNHTIFASSVSAGATVDDTSDLVQYSHSGWEHGRDPFFWNETFSSTATTGASIQISFLGTGIWIYGAISVEGTVFSVETIRKYGREDIRNVTRHTIESQGIDVPIYKAPIFVDQNLPFSNMYTYNITLLAGKLQIDYVRVAGKVVPSDFDTVVETSVPITPYDSTPSSLDYKAVVISAACGTVFAFVLAIATLLFCKKYGGQISFSDSHGSQGQNGQKTRVEPFYPDCINESPSLSRKAKGKFTQDFSLLRSGSGPSNLPSSSTISISQWDDSLITTSSSSSPTVTVAIASISGGQPSAVGENSLQGELGEHGLSLSHADLARLFERAEELRLIASEGRGLDRDGKELEPPLENLARQLATRSPSIV
ncbi:hypothetical protein FRC17_009299 [Serendipita sp. 399]|nr:hypothetical protein FRC17_009299 [Serendipita sp. 399]